jgi:hypothetical protein
MRMKIIEIELTDSASAVLTEMARRGKVKPEAIARICVEDTLSQAVDLLIGDGDEVLLKNARDPDETCRICWEEVQKPGDYARALKRDEVTSR